jgi:hypothetical protein
VDGGLVVSTGDAERFAADLDIARVYFTHGVLTLSGQAAELYVSDSPVAQSNFPATASPGTPGGVHGRGGSGQQDED